MNIHDYSGAKLAVVASGHVLTLLRDNHAGIPFPGLWDLPGGGREPGEGPIDCALRECWEETRLRMTVKDVSWRRVFPSERKGALPTWFLVAEPGWLVLPAPRLGDEGQDVRWMKLEEFLIHPKGIPHLQDRLRRYLSSVKGMKFDVGSKAWASGVVSKKEGRETFSEVKV